jgi:hypothetical protein
VAPLAVLSAPALASAVRAGNRGRRAGAGASCRGAIGGLVVMAGAVQNHGTASNTTAPPQ